MTENNRNRARRSLGCRNRERAGDGHDHPYLAADQISGQFWQAVRIVIRPAILDRQILALGEACLFQALTESREVVGGGCADLQ
jgi:hypothetical protein